MFALIWLSTALDQLADAYVAANSEDRARMAAGIEALNARLRADPLSVGESRVGGFRVDFVPRLAILFHVSETDRIVRVVRLRPSRR
jgi:ParE toxin of type II toxin-antitoxin system, parDE